MVERKPAEKGCCSGQMVCRWPSDGYPVGVMDSHIEKDAGMNWLKRMTSKRLREYRRRFPTCDIDVSARVDSTCEVGDYTFIGHDVDVTKTQIGSVCPLNHRLSQISQSA